ncbi:flagellin, partial [Vibrio parahaemolyticus]|nr:flagellin [Vibrio parahaemolyticus]
AKDHAAGLQSSNRLQTQLSGLDVARRSAHDGSSSRQTAACARNEVPTLMHRMRDGSLPAAPGSHSPGERPAVPDAV